MHHIFNFFANSFNQLLKIHAIMTKKYGLLGHPLGHSFSRKFHNERFAKLGIDAEYVNFDLEEVTQLPAVLAAETQLCGLNVTIPYKQQVMQFLDELDPVAERIGAVNTICIRRIPAETASHLPGLWLKGYNTDIIGFSQSIGPLLVQAGILPLADGKVSSKTKALILGTGGASKAVKVALEDFGIEPVFVSRTAAPGRLTYADLTPELMAQYLVVVNCSPVGMYPHVDECPDIPYDSLTSHHVCYDLIYNPEVTQFLAKAKENGAFTMSGGAMLKGQALASYDYWTQTVER